jgi:NADH:quinone reductase (non-electrogenic)
MISNEQDPRNSKASASRQGSRRRVVILGGGFAGLHAARRLQRTLAHQRDLEAALISRENYVLFTPMLHEVAAGDLDPADIVIPLRKTVRQVRLIQAEVADIDLQARVIRYAVGALRQPRELPYDHLLLALGSETNYFGMKHLEAAAEPRCRLAALPRCQVSDERTSDRKPSSLVWARARSAVVLSA